VLYPKEAEPGSALAEECLERLCGSDEARRTTVRRVMERLRRNETTQSDWQRKLLRRL
jgi:predicted transcriptional regulator